jgi:cytidine diphosphoramidate kinase
MIIWITGLSGAGKTTLSNAIAGLLRPRLPHLVVVDGDVVRELFGNDLDYTIESRRKQIQRIQRLSLWLEGQGCVVMVAALYASPELLEWNRKYFKSYFEIYIEAPLDLLRARDGKGLYAKATAGEASHVVGVDIPWLAPSRPDFRVDAARREPPDETARKIVAAIPQFGAVTA